ncbi:MAG: cupin domain-containing protein [Proteobacteria bacterium]|nr:cupin domain-containing protein [Pseudomonadota bacterium]MBI3498735.1 cupin domain-containing protein [Pseudomonadota bacterium]
MAEANQSKCLLTAKELAAAAEVHIRHPFNPKSEIYLKRLARPVGMQRLSLAIARVPPGKESFIYHSQERDEEFLYILSGRGLAEIAEAVIEVGPGDFMGFPTPSVGHHLTNPFEEDLVYLMGGESSGFDIGSFPKIGKRLIFTETGISCIDDAHVRPMSFAEWLPDGMPTGAAKPDAKK